MTAKGLPTDRSRRRGVQHSYGMPGSAATGRSSQAFRPPPRAIRSAAPRSATLAKDLAAYEQAKSALHFGPERPLPVALVKKRLNARMVEVRARGH